MAFVDYTDAINENNEYNNHRYVDVVVTSSIEEQGLFSRIGDFFNNIFSGGTTGNFILDIFI